ncbi:MAG: hypothetical protein H7A37_06490 [Chlamydiales bacterium]|nr:hypothetical protein [Chlamydiia bacterium]MCP5507930.1 hypothetical protein [Chlamydiales bacterium]
MTVETERFESYEHFFEGIEEPFVKGHCGGMTLRELTTYWDQERESCSKLDSKQCLKTALLSRICWFANCFFCCPTTAAWGGYSCCYGAGCIALGMGCAPITTAYSIVSCCSEDSKQNLKLTKYCCVFGCCVCASGACMEAIAVQTCLLCIPMMIAPEGPETCGVFKCLASQFKYGDSLRYPS